MADTSSSLLPAPANVCHSPQTPLTIHLRTDTQNTKTPKHPLQSLLAVSSHYFGPGFLQDRLDSLSETEILPILALFYNFQGDPSFCWRFIESLDKTFLTENIQWEIQLSASLF